MSLGEVGNLGFCPKCRRENPNDAVFCAYCAAPMTAVPKVAAPAAVMSTTQQQTDVKPIATVGIICAVLSLFFFPPIFGISAILLGAYALSKASEEQKSLCWYAIIFGVIFMILGIFLGMLTAF
ncbi:MAG: zinc-ribbon domain-containing protein [Candidatus Bathyarchaeota archaeon]|nr:MAG: zinc-ribbon domain-containing protein [Candidatus Bathyarchaeota archaeon]